MVDVHPLVPPPWLAGLNEELNELNSTVTDPRGPRRRRIGSSS
jgi:hypothetical protein